ncbi:hypothetical protein AU210_007138 [Fusarium oxysporum f. sp. radicis-cucumerinum]|uniref:Uncharacterized protein n=1 Tax=Fusarium oxysporum f. sp. radicis-cucumerinum TaxID=327505 RepID=A0A2H3H7T1_FUSOX|nr:hypothetical protein AU210_007138 [Fusarium oxysporum f. sp. radicis-cucumerinum]
MSSIQKLIYHWKQGQFIPGGKHPQPLNNEVKEQRLSKLNSDDIIALEITKGISILRDAVEAFKKTQEFNKDPTSFIGDARDVLMSDDFLLLADVLRLIFPEGMISEVWQLKRGRDEDLDTQDDACAPGNRRIFMPISKRPRFTNGPKAQENKTQRENKARGLFSMPASQLRFTNGSETQRENKAGGLFSMPASQLSFANGPETQAEATRYTGIFGAKDKDSMPASQLRFINGPETQVEATGYTGIFGAKDKDSNNSPALQRNGIFSQRMSFASEKPKSPVFSEGTEKVSDTSPTPQYTGIFGAKSSKPQTGGIFSTTSPGLEHTGSSSQPIGSLSGNKEEAIVDNLLSSVGTDDVNKILAQLQLRQQGIKRKHEKEGETTNKKRDNTQEPHSLI